MIVQVRRQTFSYESKQSKSLRSFFIYHNIIIFKVRGASGSLISIGLNIVRQEGLATLYRGLTPALLRYLVGLFCNFLIQDFPL